VFDCLREIEGIIIFIIGMALARTIGLFRAGEFNE